MIFYFREVRRDSEKNLVFIIILVILTSIKLAISVSDFKATHLELSIGKFSNHESYHK